MCMARITTGSGRSATIRRLWLTRTDGQTVECGPDLAPDWFAATVGGIGLTGLIARVELQLRRVPGLWLTTETIPYVG